MSLGERLREMLDPGATAGSSGTNGTSGRRAGPTRRRPRSQAQPVNPTRSYDTEPSRPMPRAQWIGLGLAAALAVALTAGLVFVVLTMIRPGTQTATQPTPLPVVASPTAGVVGRPDLRHLDAAAQRAHCYAAGRRPARFRSANTGTEGANLRREPGQGGERMKTIPDGTLVEVVGPDRTVDGIVWRNVRDLQGETGWIAGSFLAAEGSAPAAGIPGSSLGPADSATAPAASTPAAPRPTTAVAPSSAHAWPGRQHQRPGREHSLRARPERPGPEDAARGREHRGARP